MAESRLEECEDITKRIVELQQDLEKQKLLSQQVHNYSYSAITYMS